jgi:hypothetical protein
MGDLPQTFDGLIPDLLSRTLGGDKTRESLLPGGQVLQEPVVLQIGNRWFGHDIVLIVVQSDLLSQILDLF